MKNPEPEFKGFTKRVKTLVPAVVVSFATKIHESITVGHVKTAAAGQPVDEGALINSWGKGPDIQDNVAVIATDSPYAIPIEEGQGPHGPLTLRSRVGGFHSVKATRANADRLLAEAVAEFGDG